MKRLVHSPLFTWFLVLVTVTAALVVLAQIDPVKVHINQRRREVPKKIQKVKQAAREVDIVFFGNSLLQYAIPASEEEIGQAIARRVQRRSGAPAEVRVLNLASDGRAASDIQRRSDQILELKPKLMVIQTEMVVARKAKIEPRRQGLLAKERDQISNWIRYAKAPLVQSLIAEEGSSRKQKELLEALSSPVRVDIRILKTEDEAKQQESLEQANLRRASERWADQDLSADSPRYVAARDFIRKARESGTRVLVLETPVSQTAARFATEEYLQERRDLVQALLEPESRDYLSYPELMPDGYFLDYSHVTTRGRRTFFAWLARILAERLAEGK